MKTAEGDSDETGKDGKERRDDGADEHPEESFEAASGDDGDTSDSATTKESGDEVSPRGAGGNIGVCNGGFLDVLEEATDAGAEDIRGVDSKGADDER